MTAAGHQSKSDFLDYLDDKTGGQVFYAWGRIRFADYRDGGGRVHWTRGTIIDRLPGIHR